MIGGDGIGPDVVAEAMKVVTPPASTRRCPSTSGAPRYLRDGAVLPDEDSRRCGHDAIMLGAVGTPGGPPRPPGVLERGMLLRLRFELDLYINHRPFLAGPEPAQRRPRLDRRPREHRGHLRGRGRLPAQGHPARDRHAGFGQHPHGVERCARYAFDLAESRRAQAPDARAQDERAHLRRRPVAAHLRHGRRRLPRRRPGTTTSTPPASTSCRTRAATTSSSPTTSSATSSPTWVGRWPVASAAPHRRT